MEQLLVELSSKVGAVEAKVDACHRRQDKLEEIVTSDLLEIKMDVKKLISESHFEKGRLAGIVLTVSLAASLLGGALGVLVKFLMGG